MAQAMKPEAAVPENTAPDQPPPSSPAEQRRGGGRAGSKIFTTVMTILVAYLVIVPLIILLYSSLKNSTTDLPFQVEGFSFGNFSRIFESGQLGTVTFNTVVYTVGALIVATVVSVCLAYLIERTDIPAPKFLSPMALAPMAIPATVMAIAWMLVANPSNGPLALLLSHVFGIDVNINSLAGMALVMGISGVPSMYLMIAPAFAQLNPALEEAAAAVGASLFRRLRIIVLPLVGPAISAAAMLLVVLALEGFAIPAILGLPDRIFVFSSLIQYSLQPPNGVADYGKASTYGVLILIVSLIMLLVYRRRVRDSHRFQVVNGKGYRQNRAQLGGWRIPAFVLVCLYMVICVGLPILALLYTSFSPYIQPITWSGLSSMTFDNYTNALTAPGIGKVLANTAMVVLITATVTTAISVWLAVAAHRKQFRGAGLLFESTFLVFGIPSVVLGTAVMFLYLFLPIHIYGTNWIIIVALVARFLPRGSRMIQTPLMQLDDGLIEAARVTGASAFTVNRTVLLPLLRPVLLKCWFWVFAVALGELPIALLLTTADNRTLVVQLWNAFTSSGDYPQASALAVIILLISVIAVWLINRGSDPKEAKNL